MLLLAWLASTLFAGDLIHRLHGGLFGISSHELDVMLYGGMGLLKLLVLVIFFIPWLAIKYVRTDEECEDRPEGETG